LVGVADDDRGTVLDEAVERDAEITIEEWCLKMMLNDMQRWLESMKAIAVLYSMKLLNEHSIESDNGDRHWLQN
jgi:hypothetical protein